MPTVAARRGVKPASYPTPSTTPPPGARSPARTRVLPEAADAVEERSSGTVWLGAAGAVVLVLVGLVVFRGKEAPPPAAPSPEASMPSVVVAPAGAVPPAAEPAGDAGLRARVHQTLALSAPLRDARIDVDVSGGIVTLTGEAPNAVAQELAGSLAATVPGVRKVLNAIQLPAVEAPAAAAAAAPAEAATSAPVASAPSPPPAPPGDDGQRNVHALLERARREVEAGNPDGANRLFEEVLRLQPDNPIAKDALERWRSGKRPPPR
jgi:hypothetical protein